jgi:hypothetical protein
VVTWEAVSGTVAVVRAKVEMPMLFRRREIFRIGCERFTQT